MILFEAQNISKTFSAHRALNNVSIAVEQGSVFGLLGPNGAGKSTLIRIINQIIAPDSGLLFFNNQKLEGKHIANIGYLPEERGLYKKMKVGEQALYLAQLKGLSKKEATQRLKYWFEKFEISGWWNRKVEELSKGMQQKVQFIVTVLHQPQLLIFDEPFSGFDPINANLLKQEILQLKENGTTIIFSTHNMESVEELCDQIALINKSENILNGSVLDIKNQYRKRIYEISCVPFAELSQETFGQHTILQWQTTHQVLKLKVKLDEATAYNDLLQLIIPHANILSFNEILPSMNDIFIEKVTETNKAKEVAHE